LNDLPTGGERLPRLECADFPGFKSPGPGSENPRTIPVFGSIVDEHHVEVVRALLVVQCHNESLRVANGAVEDLSPLKAERNSSIALE
jgi:hypothetical protein